MLGEVDGAFEAVSLDFESGVLDFEIEAISEDAGVPFDKFAGFVVLIGEEEPGEFGGGAAGEADDTFAAFFEEWAVDARFVVEALEVGGGGQPDEVIEAGAIHGEQCEVCGGLLLASGGAIGPEAWCDVGFVTDDGANATGFAGVVEFDGAVEVAVIGDGDGVHAMRFDMGNEFGDAIDAIEKAVMGVAVEVSEGSCGRGDCRGCWCGAGFGHVSRFRSDGERFRGSAVFFGKGTGCAVQRQVSARGADSMPAEFERTEASCVVMGPEISCRYRTAFVQCTCF
ncbi:MAG: hypothetical protein RL215_1392 [Planctomycetota bacterium]